MRQASKFKKIAITIIVILLVLAFLPIPYYQTPATCKMGQTCPQPGWHFFPPLAFSFKYLIQRAGILEPTDRNFDFGQKDRQLKPSSTLPQEQP